MGVGPWREFTDAAPSPWGSAWAGAAAGGFSPEAESPLADGVGEGGSLVVMEFFDFEDPRRRHVSAAVGKASKICPA